MCVDIKKELTDFCGKDFPLHLIRKFITDF